MHTVGSNPIGSGFNTWYKSELGKLNCIFGLANTLSQFSSMWIEQKLKDILYSPNLSSSLNWCAFSRKWNL